MLGQHAAAGLTDVASGASARVPERWGENPGYSGQAGHRVGCTLSRRRRRLPGQALVELEAGVQLGDKVPVRHRLGSIIPGGRSAGGGDRGWAWRLTEGHENALDGRGIGDEGNEAHIRRAVGTDQR
jgi:hypothetical protein